MKNTIAYMLESESKFGLGVQTKSENEQAYEHLQEASQDLKNLLGYTIEKVCVNSDGEDYFIEYSNNLERYMEDQKIYTIEEAVKNIAEHYGLIEEDITIIVDESCLDKVDIGALSEKYNIIKK